MNWILYSSKMKNYTNTEGLWWFMMVVHFITSFSKKTYFTFSETKFNTEGRIFWIECQVMFHLQQFSPNWNKWAVDVAFKRTHRRDSLALIMCDEMLRAGWCVWKACDVGGVEDESRRTLQNTQWQKSFLKHRHTKYTVYTHMILSHILKGLLYDFIFQCFCDTEQYQES